MSNKTIFITGGKGMVGSNLLEHPLASRYKIFAPSRYELDLTDYKSVKNYLNDLKPDVIIHAAGKVGGIQANIAKPVDFLVENMEIGKNIILAAREAKVRCLLNLGSSCMYPREAMNPLREESILHGELEPTNEGYALAKIMTARLCQYVSMQDEFYQYKTVIPCNLYGRHDKFDPAHSHLIPAIIHKIDLAKKNNLKSIDIWGDGNARREFMYAGDMADALIRSIENFDSLPSLINFGLGHDYSINEYYKTVASVIGWDGEFIHDLSKPVGMKQKLVSVNKQEEWGWGPKTSLREGIEYTYQFYLKESAL